MAPIFQRRGLSSSMFPQLIPGESYETKKIQLVHIPQPSPTVIATDFTQSIEEWIDTVEKETGADAVRIHIPEIYGDEVASIAKSLPNTDEMVIEDIVDSYLDGSDSCYSGAASDAVTHVVANESGADFKAQGFVEALEKTLGKNPFSPFEGNGPEEVYLLSPGNVECHDHLRFKNDIYGQHPWTDLEIVKKCRKFSDLGGAQHFPRDNCQCANCDFFRSEVEVRRIMTALPRDIVPPQLKYRFDQYHARQEEQPISSLQSPSYFRRDTQFERYYIHFGTIFKQRELCLKDDFAVFYALSNWFATNKGIEIPDLIDSLYVDGESTEDNGTSSEHPSKQVNYIPKLGLAPPSFEDLEVQTKQVLNEKKELEQLYDLCSPGALNKPLTCDDAEDLLDLVDSMDIDSA
ncbi:hypothetical protein HYFRA_00013356 [Hymenoscyphus fraxineus]|uniref:Uncharacterized protein n=1 Tax=Hymenoscyphus fraxineus TaxID=746836 RepID=A0A9N9LBE2_9HELO|nr:hypothetical protein HYFRA_00013356 [Hymenoscyphus fraxineus]